MSVETINQIITSIVPIRAEEFEFYRERLDLRKNINLSHVQTILVDDGSPLEVAQQLASYCAANNFQYERIESMHERFSLSRARNRGIDLAVGEWIIQEDADVIYTTGFYENLVEEVKLLDATPFNFLSVPVVYLNPEVSAEVVAHGSVDRFVPRILSRLAIENPKGSPENRDIQHYAPASAIFVARKKMFLRAGAYDEYFSGWGGEDRDLAFRFLHLNDSLVRPDGFDQTKAWNLNDTVAFEGWRALYRSIGDYLALKGIYGYHIYHDQLPWRTGGDTRPNIEFAKEKAKQVTKTNFVRPRAIPGAGGDIVLGSNPYLVNSQVLDVLENPRVVTETPGQNPAAFCDWLQAQNPRNVLMWNPYGTPWRLQVSRILRERGVNVIVGERGALPDAFYFDAGGLCVESNSYDEAIWNHPVDDPVRRREVQNYIEDIRFGAQALEGQAPRVNIGMLRASLKIPEGKKILFVPLQLSDDTVTTHFSLPERGYSDYLLELQKIASRLPMDWVMVCKNHPLAREKANFPGVFVADGFHINDLIESASAITLFNSGTGMIAMAFNKPVFYYGKCFYAADGINWPFVDAKSMIDMMTAGEPVVNADKVLSFYNYLLNEFYSFAKVETELAVGTATSMRSKLKSLRYTCIRIPGLPHRHFGDLVTLNPASILLDRYRFFWWHKTQQPAAKPLTPAEVSAKPTPAAKPPVVGAPSASAVKSATVADYSELDEKIRSKLVYKLYSVVAAPFMSERLSKKLKKSPTLYFVDGKSMSTRFVRPFVLPKP